jgi:hypothetical protein
MRKLTDFASELDIGEFEFSRGHWAVKDVDLYQILCRMMQAPRFMPRVFELKDQYDPTLISVMMPFSEGFDPVYEAIVDCASALKLECKRADDIWENEAVIQDIVDLIARSQVVICDCTGRNPNVFYEAGIAHTLGKNVILITQSREDIPFDVSHIRYVQYLNNGEGRAALTETLKPRIRDLIG